MRKLILVVAIAMIASLSGGATATTAAVTCTPTDFYRDNINMTAAQIGGNVTGTLDATDCHIGVYYGPGDSGVVEDAEIYGASYFGVVARQADVDVLHSSVHDIGDSPAFTGAQHGVAIYFATVSAGTSSSQPVCVPGATTGRIVGNNVYEYQKGGIVAACDGTTVTVSKNHVEGSYAVPYIAQNGIQIGYGATGTVQQNTVEGNRYTGPNWTSTGILVFESSGVLVQKNSVSSSQTGIAIESWCYLGSQSANDNMVVQNTVADADWGITVAAYDLNVYWSGYTSCDPQASNNRLVNNSISGSGATLSAGIFVGTWDSVPAGAHTPEATGNKVIHNKVSGFATSLELDGDTGTKVHANVY